MMQDLTLAKAMVRPSRHRHFLNDAVMKGDDVLTADRYGAARRVYVVAEEDASWPAEFQRRMASWNPGTVVKGLPGADHMPMFSKPRELSELLMEIAELVEKRLLLLEIASHSLFCPSSVQSRLLCWELLHPFLNICHI
jgi:pimeloyl-ACP methyl ester carboxylesterase